VLQLSWQLLNKLLLQLLLLLQPPDTMEGQCTAEKDKKTQD
jgi:hypothetical protein